MRMHRSSVERHTYFSPIQYMSFIAACLLEGVDIIGIVLLARRSLEKCDSITQLEPGQ